MGSHQHREQHQVPKESSRIIHVLYLTQKSIFSLRWFPFATSTSSQQLGQGSAIPSQPPQHTHTQHQTTDGGGHQAFSGLENECESPQQWFFCPFSTLLHPVLHLKEEVPAGAKPASQPLPFPNYSQIQSPKAQLPCSVNFYSKQALPLPHSRQFMLFLLETVKRYFFYSFHLFNKYFSGCHVRGTEHTKTQK